MDETPPQFLDVPTLLEASLPQRRGNGFWFAAGLFVTIILFSTWAGSQAPQLQPLIELFSVIMMAGLISMMSILTWLTVRQQKLRHEQLEAVEEMIQLRRWHEAAITLQRNLSEPARSHTVRFQSLIYLATVLARFGRFTDAIAVQNYLLEQLHHDSPTAHGLRLGRAMAMLREDHMVDADRAISELRRGGGNDSSGGLALVSIYRDVKTGHPDEAIALFNDKLQLMREQLGHRVADAYALVARAYDLLNRTSEAQAAYASATVLAPPVELQRRYPEIAPVVEKYSPTLAPAE